MRKRDLFAMLLAAQAASALFPISASNVQVIQAVAGEANSAPRVTAVAYTGVQLVVAGYPTPVVVDMDGLDHASPVPLLFEHDRKAILGQGSVTRAGSELLLAGSLQGDSPEKQNVLNLARDGFSWKLSVGVYPTKVEKVAAGQRVTVNGKQFVGPLAVVRAGKLIEVSILAIGADPNTSLQIAASFLGDSDVNFSAWLKANGFDEATLTDAQVKVLKASFEAQQEDPNKVSTVEQVLALARNRELRFAAYGRVIQGAIDRGMDTETAERLVNAAQSDNLSETEFELQVLRATRHTGDSRAASRSTEVTGDVIEAALARSCGLQDLDKVYTPEVLAAAEKQFRNGLSLVETLLLAARRNGYRDISHRDTRALLNAAFAPVHAAAHGPSTYDVGGILSNVANKKILQGFNAVEQEWTKVASVGTVSDLKLHTAYALTGDMIYKPVGKQGELEHATVGEEKYQNQAATFGRIFGLSEDDIINDDLGAFDRIQRSLGRGGALALNMVIWTAYLNDAVNFWTVARKNRITGAGSALSIAALSAAVTLLEKQTDPDGQPLGVKGAVLVVPSELKILAMQLANDPEIRLNSNGATDVTYSIKNPHAGNFSVAASAYLNNATVPGGSATAWQLLASPQDLPTLEVVFLNGQQQPRVEQARANFDTLGIYMRGVHRFGANKQEYRASVYNVGA